MKNKKPFSIFFEVDHELYIYFTQSKFSFIKTFVLSCKMMWNIFAISLIFTLPFIFLLTIGFLLEN